MIIFLYLVHNIKQQLMLFPDLVFTYISRIFLCILKATMFLLVIKYFEAFLFTNLFLALIHIYMYIYIPCTWQYFKLHICKTIFLHFCCHIYFLFFVQQKIRAVAIKLKNI